MNLRRIVTVAAVSGVVLLSIGVALSQQAKKAGTPPPQPHLFHLWTDAKGDTHMEEIKLSNNRRASITGITMNFSGLPAGEGAALLHHAPARQFAVTVSGKIDVEASDGTKAHLEPGDISFLEDTTGKGHKTLEEGASSIFLRVPDNFDIKAWARGE